MKLNLLLVYIYGLLGGAWLWKFATYFLQQLGILISLKMIWMLRMIHEIIRERERSNEALEKRLLIIYTNFFCSLIKKIIF